MQELLTGQNLYIATASSLHFDNWVAAGPADIKDVVEDLSEIQFLLGDLERAASDCAPNKSGKDLYYEAYVGDLQRISIDVRRHVDLLERASRWVANADLAQIAQQSRRQLLDLKSAIRALYKLKGALLTRNDWQSPVYRSSLPHGANRLMHGIEEHRLDYKRDGHLEAVPYEELFVSEYFSHLGSEKLKAYLTSSGMAAFSSVLHWVAHELSLPGGALAVQPMYFENIHLAQGFFPDMVRVSPGSPDELLAHLRAENPTFILCDAVTNCGAVVAHDIETIMNWASHEAGRPVVVAVDTTCLPGPTLAGGLLQHLPANLSVFLIESLAKYHQFGMDAVTGGVVVMHAEDRLHEDFKKTRARLGTNIPDASAASLPAPNRRRLISRLKRHSRNACFIAERLEEIALESEGVVDSISWISDGPRSAPWYTSSCFTINLRRQFRSLDKYKEFEDRVLQSATRVGHQLALGTSFGFDISRLYVTAPSTPFEDPFLRISVGTESASEIVTLAKILAEASADLFREWKSESVNIPSKDVSGRTAPAKILPVRRGSGHPGLRKSVYLGETGLKDYLSPVNYAPAPLVELPAELNPLREDGVRIFAKMIPLVPLMNIKSIPAFSMLSRAAERGRLDEVKNIVESSSSNTVLSLSVIGRLFGVENTSAIVDHSIAPGLLRMLRLFGIEILLHPAAGHALFGKMEPRSQRARSLGDQPGWINPGQYSNPDNPEGFARWLAPDIWSQTNGRLSVLSCGLGTCGTMVGVGRALSERNPDLKIVACCPLPGDAVPGPRENSLLGDVTFDWHNVPTERLDLSSQESFVASVNLLRKGILAGPSSGMNYAGALRYLSSLKEAGQLASMLDSRGELWTVFLCCDSPLPHVDEYFDALGDDFFPPIHPVPEV